MANSTLEPTWKGLPTPLVSVITPSYNQAGFLEQTVLSVLDQDYPSVEYVVVDGASTDGTLDILRSYGDRLAWISEPDSGQADAINKGLRLAKGQVVAYLNSDDVYLPGAIRTAVEYLRAHPEVGLVYGDCRVIGPGGEPLGLISAPEPDVQRWIHRGEFVPQPAAFWRREVIGSVGLFDEGLHYALDYDFFVRVALAFPAAHIPHPLAAFRLHGASKTTSGEERHWQESMQVSRRYGSGWHSPWYAWRALRHWGLRMLPRRVQRSVRRWLARPQDAVSYDPSAGGGRV
jgi:glycosyltransferase involved in cell wall biosynthesis